MVFSIGFNEKLAGAAYGVLNALRVCNIVSLLSVQVATWIMIIMSGTTNQFYFFDAATQFLVFLWAVFLMFTELTFIKFTKNWIHANWPVFSNDHSLLWLGLMMMALSCNILGNLNNPTFHIDNLGLPWWRAILASGILSMIFGVFNIVASVIFRNPANGVTAREFRSKGAVANEKQTRDIYSEHNSHKMYEENYDQEHEKPSRFRRMTQRFTKRSKPQISGPIPHDTVRNDDLEAGRSSYDRESWAEDRRSPIVPDIQRPPTACHPANTGSNHSRQYSVAEMSRFSGVGDRYDMSGKAF